MEKDEKRFSYTRISTYKQCPRKHRYLYLEDIIPKENQYTAPGKLFHKAIELNLKGEDMQPAFDEFRKLCRSGYLDLEEDLLEYIVDKYINYYSADAAEEYTLLVEQEFNDDLDDEGNYLSMVVDHAYERDERVVVRDIKTTQGVLKYGLHDVMYNQQLLLYLPYVEEELGQPVSAIQIDEVRLAKLKPVPFKANGKPSTDKKLLGLVTYEDYYNELSNLGLQSEKEYEAVLEYLEQRGHPLFNRVTAQVLDQKLVASNAEDFLSTFNMAKQSADYRVKGPLCNYCVYSDLCKLDYTDPDQASRQAIIDRIKK